uniref:Leucine-rich repeat-containing protein DDB_G0290503 isoform X2 n=1 Tax=Dermatophagoides pteronyssinus TaxID=6956 RepID=A0A6P6YD79_DERPT|nr:putative leucine-rich repeat-containing protein DDB_G0290503 isoform X2 [Dermatophagoides pteronyssinus]
MVHRIQSCRLSDEFKIELNELIEYAEKFDEQQREINDELKRLQNDVEKFGDRERKYQDQQRKCITECRSIETEAMELMEELKSIYEEKIANIKKHYEKQFLSMVTKHKSEIQTWRSKCETVSETIHSSPTKVLKNEKIHHQQEQEVKAERKRLEERIEELQRENKRLKTRVESAENRIEQNETKRKTIENDLRKSKNECDDRDDEIRKQKSKINELETAINKQKRQLDEKETKITELKRKNEKLEKELSQVVTPIKSSWSSALTAEIPHPKITDDNASSGCGGLYSSSDNDNDDVQTLKSKLIISEHDIRAVNRRLENKTEICNILRAELSEIKQKLSDYEKGIDDEKKRSNGYSELVSTYQSELNENKHEIERKDAEIVNLKCLIDENNNNFNLKLKELSENERKLRMKTSELNRRIDTLMKEIESCKRKNADLHYLVEKTTNDLNRSNNENEQLQKKNEKYRKLLKCCEEQLDQYNVKFPNLLNQQKSQSSDTISVLNHQIMELKKKNETLHNEVEELQTKLIEQQKLTESIVENEKLENNRLQRQLQIEQSKTERMEVEINHQQSIFDTKEQELFAIKEEAAGHITKISQITKERFELETKCESMVREIELLNERLELFRANLNEKSNEIYLLEETISQQRKLIDYMQSNCKCLEKKKPFMLFSFGSKSTNTVGGNNDNNHHSSKTTEELERKLKNEREKNEFLNERLNEMIDELDQRSSDVENLKQKVQELNTQLMSKGYFEHIVGEHNFTNKTMKLPDVCVACAKSITIGSKAKKCKKCGALIHNGCRLSYNCGLSLEMVRIKSFGLGGTTPNRKHHNYDTNDYDNISDMIDNDGSIATFTDNTIATTTTADESDINSINSFPYMKE